MNYNHVEIQYRMQPCSKFENGRVTLLPMSRPVAQDVLTDIVMHELMHCKAAEEAREIEQKLRIISENTDMDVAGYMGQVHATIQKLEKTG